MIGSWRKRPTVLLRAAAACDATGQFARPAAIALRKGKIVAFGHPEDAALRKFEAAQTVEMPRTLVLPAMVNAHTHLNLHNLGPRSYSGSFTDWLKMVIRDSPRDPDALAAAIRSGASASVEAGVGWVGDIAPSVEAIRMRLETQLPGVSFLELFGIGSGEADAIAQLRDSLKDLPFETRVPEHNRGIVLGLQPHAPYSAGRQLYREAVRQSQIHTYRLATHLAETRDEIEFVRDRTGPFVDLLKDLGKWQDGVAPTQADHPVDLLKPLLREGRWLLAHCNYLTDAHIELLAKSGAAVAYCPVASSYFGHSGHRYREMIEAGVDVCLGTDSIVCQPADEAQPAGILPQMRHLYKRDQTNPILLLKMATTTGLTALGLDETEGTLRPHARANLIGVDIDPDDAADPLVQALVSSAPVRPIDVSEDSKPA